MFVIGYSLRPSDIFFRDLLALGLVGGTRLRKFTVVDPDAAVAARFQELLGPDARPTFEHIAGNFEDFAIQKFGKPKRAS